MIGKRTYLFSCPVDWPIRGEFLVTTFEDEAPMIAWRQDSGTVWGVAIDGKETTSPQDQDPRSAEDILIQQLLRDGIDLLDSERCGERTCPRTAPRVDGPTPGRQGVPMTLYDPAELLDAEAVRDTREAVDLEAGPLFLAALFWLMTNPIERAA